MPSPVVADAGQIGGATGAVAVGVDWSLMVMLSPESSQALPGWVVALDLALSSVFDIGDAVVVVIADAGAARRPGAKLTNCRRYIGQGGKPRPIKVAGIARPG